MGAMSRFPSQLTKNLYLANLTNIMSKECTQLKMLGIENIVAMTPTKIEGLEEYNQLHFEVEKFEKDLQSLLDLEQIAEESKQLTGKTLLLDINGSLACALGVKLLMAQNKMFTKELAVAKVMNLRYEIKDMPSWLYSMI